MANGSTLSLLCCASDLPDILDFLLSILLSIARETVQYSVLSGTFCSSSAKATL